MDIQVLYDKVASLDDVADIVSYLESQGIRGHLGMVSSCPLAQYFKQGERVFDVVVSDSVQINLGDNDGRTFPLTSTMTKFIQNFDGGDYPTITTEGIDDCEW